MTITKYMVIDTSEYYTDDTSDAVNSLRKKYCVHGEFWSEKDAQEAIDQSCAKTKKHFRVVPVSYNVTKTAGYPFIMIENDAAGEASYHWKKTTLPGYQILDLFRIMSELTEGPEHEKEFVDRLILNLNNGTRRLNRSKIEALQFLQHLVGRSIARGNTGLAKVMEYITARWEDSTDSSIDLTLHDTLIEQIFDLQNYKLYDHSSAMVRGGNLKSDEVDDVSGEQYARCTCTIYMEPINSPFDNPTGVINLNIIAWVMDPVHAPDGKTIALAPMTQQPFSQMRLLARTTDGKKFFHLRSKLIGKLHNYDDDIYNSRLFLDTTPVDPEMYNDIIEMHDAFYDSNKEFYNIPERERAEINTKFGEVTNIPMATLDLSKVRTINS